MSDWVTPKQAAETLQVSISTIRAMLRRGDLRARRLRGSRLLRIARADLDALLEPLPPLDAPQAALHAVRSRTAS